MEQTITSCNTFLGEITRYRILTGRCEFSFCQYFLKIFAFPQRFLYNKHSFCHSAIVLKRQEEDYDLKYCFMDQ